MTDTPQPVTVDQVVARYMQLRVEVEQLSAKHALEMEPFGVKMKAIETWLLAKMNIDGVTSYRTEHGTPYKKNSTSVTLADRNALLQYVFDPFIKQLAEITGLPPNSLSNALLALGGWNLVDVRAGKKGIEEKLEQSGILPPGVNRSVITNVQVRAK